MSEIETAEETKAAPAKAPKSAAVHPPEPVTESAVANKSVITLRDYCVGKPRSVLHVLSAAYGDPRRVSCARGEWERRERLAMAAPTMHSPIVGRRK